MFAVTGNKNKDEGSQMGNTILGHLIRSFTLPCCLSLMLSTSVDASPDDTSSDFTSTEIVVIVNPNNPIETLSERDIKRIFLGRLRQFPNTDNAVEVLDQNSTSAIFERFYTEFIGFGLRKLRRYRAAYLFSGKGTLPVELNDPTAVKTKILNNQSAIGYIDARLVDDSVKVIYRWPISDPSGQHGERPATLVLGPGLGPVLGPVLDEHQRISKKAT